MSDMREHRPIWQRIGLGLVSAAVALVAFLVVVQILGGVGSTTAVTGFIVALVIGVLIYRQA